MSLFSHADGGVGGRRVQWVTPTSKIDPDRDAKPLGGQAAAILAHLRAAGAVPLDVTALGVEFCVGGSVKWLCGGPGAGWLYVRPDIAEQLEPAFAGWQGHARHMRQALKTADQGVPLTPLPEGAPALSNSNLGMFEVRQFTAIIPPDSTAILAVGTVREEPVVRNRQIEIGDRCALTLAADHRVVDEVTAAKFLERIQIHLKSL